MLKTSPGRRMTGFLAAMSDPRDIEESVRRVRRGCSFIALLVASFGVLYASATGNPLFLSLLLAALAIFIFARLVR